MAESKNFDELNQQCCCVCRAISPMTHTNYTLISPKHQWRMTLRTAEDGSREPMWYCPECWRVTKQSRAPASNKP